jgi:hypothetical protein
LLCSGSTLWHLQNFLQCNKFIILQFTPSTALFYCPFPIPGMVSSGIIFVFTYKCTHFCTILTLLSFFPTTSPLLPLAQILPPCPRQDLFCPLVLQF